MARWFHLIEQRGPSVVFGEQVASPDGLAGSSLFKLTWKELTTPSGLPIFALRASVLRTSDSVFGSWPSPVVNDAKGSDYTYAQGNHDRIVVEAGRSGEAGELADADGGNAGTERLQRRGEQRQFPQDGSAIALAHASGPRLQAREDDGSGYSDAQKGARGEQSLRDCSAIGAGPVNGFWRAADWIYCRDQKVAAS
jgi:hypothetical protein